MPPENRVEARIHPRRKQGDTEVVNMDLFQNGEPVILGGGGNSPPLPVWAKFFWNFDGVNGNYLVQGEKLDFNEIDGGEASYVEVDPDDTTKLLLPSGIYAIRTYWSWSLQSTDPTYMQISATSLPLDASAGYIVPDQLVVEAGAGLPLPMVSSLAGNSWGIANREFYVQLNPSNDSPDLRAVVWFHIARIGQTDD